MRPSIGVVRRSTRDERLATGARYARLNPYPIPIHSPPFLDPLETKLGFYFSGHFSPNRLIEGVRGHRRKDEERAGGGSA